METGGSQETMTSNSGPGVPAGFIVGETVTFRVALWVGSASIILLLLTVVCTVPGIPWNSARLTPSFALAYGHPIYALRDSGAQLGWFYGPVFPLWYLPVTLTTNPTAALVLVRSVISSH